MSRYFDYYRKHLQLLRVKELYSEEVEDQLESLNQIIFHRIEAQSKMEFRNREKFIPKFTPSEVLIPRHIWRHDRKKIRCDFFKKTRGAKFSRRTDNELQRTQSKENELLNLSSDKINSEGKVESTSG